MPAERLTWAALATLLSTSAGCGTGGTCNTSELPPTDPCFMRGCCETVNEIVLPDGGVIVVPPGTDAGVPIRTRFCGACNG